MGYSGEYSQRRMLPWDPKGWDAWRDVANEKGCFYGMGTPGEVQPRRENAPLG